MIICWTSLFVILGVSDLYCHFCSIFDGKFVSKQCRPGSDADLGLLCLPMILLRVSR